ncbi:MarR family winged helix-turn-helix transcriptional regulator [Nocardia sp. KC 131]|uniref:MarR family winged helix-turn-helix transcriptional regulator n=1 Tax=Nocardia arseniciresistens TaxID=3392119 RepID=UPI00398F1EBB
MTSADQPSIPLSEHPAFLLGQLGFHVTHRFAAMLAPLGISPRHFGMLRLLSANDGQSQRQLCAVLSIHRNVMVGLVDELEKHGLVERRKHPTDRRAHAVHLLAAGHKVVAEAEEIVKSLDAEVLWSLDVDQRATLTRLLQQTSVGSGLTPGVHPGIRPAHRD